MSNKLLEALFSPVSSELFLVRSQSLALLFDALYKIFPRVGFKGMRAEKSP
jgi:hypothetical protein